MFYSHVDVVNLPLLCVVITIVAFLFDSHNNNNKWFGPNEGTGRPTMLLFDQRYKYTDKPHTWPKQKKKKKTTNLITTINVFLFVAQSARPSWTTLSVPGQYWQGNNTTLISQDQTVYIFVCVIQLMYYIIAIPNSFFVGEQKTTNSSHRLNPKLLQCQNENTTTATWDV